MINSTQVLKAATMEFKFSVGDLVWLKEPFDIGVHTLVVIRERIVRDGRPCYIVGRSNVPLEEDCLLLTSEEYCKYQEERRAELRQIFGRSSSEESVFDNYF